MMKLEGRKIFIFIAPTGVRRAAERLWRMREADLSAHIWAYFLLALGMMPEYNW